MSKDAPFKYIKTAESFYGKNDVAANIYLRKAARLGHKEAWFQLAFRFATGVPYVDEDKAYECLHVAQRLGSFRASNALRLLEHVPSIEDHPFTDDIKIAVLKAVEEADLEPASQLSIIAGLDYGYGAINLDDENEISISKDLASVGDVLAALDLHMAYYEEAIYSHDKDQSEGSYFWGLIENYLWGYEDWEAHATSLDVLSDADNARIVEDAKAWIKAHPLAKITHDSWSYRRELENGRVGVDCLY